MSATLDRTAGRARRAELPRNLLLAVGSIAIVVALFEVGLRIAGFHAIYEMYSKPTIFWQYDALLGWSQQPSARGEYVGPRPWPVEFRTPVSINSLGLRGPEPEALPAGGQRILVLGDSMVAAFEVPEEATFTSLLGRRVSASLGVPVQAINGGVRGYGTDQSLLYYRERGRQLRPDFVVFFYSGNDLIDNTTLHEMRRPFGKPAYTLDGEASLTLVGSPVPAYPACSEVRLVSSQEVQRVDGVLGRSLCRVQMSLFDHSALFSFLTQLVPWDGNVLGWLYYVGNPHLTFGMDTRNAEDGESYEYKLTRTLVAQLAREVWRDGAGFLVIGEEAQLDQLGRPPLEAQGLELLSLTPIEGASHEEIRFRHDSHYNAIGHERLAALLAAVVERRLDARARGSAG